MATFFGRCNSDGTVLTGEPHAYDDVGSLATIWNIGAFTCPGSGNQNIQDLSVYCYRGVTAVNIRLGVYNSTGTTLIAEGTAQVAVATGVAWQGHMTQASVKAAGGSSPGVLVGGTTYLFLFTSDLDGSSLQAGYEPGGGGTVVNYAFQDDTGGMPSSVPSSDGNSINFYMIRCGVNAAGGGRTTFNTASNKLGCCYGMNFGIPR